MQVSDPINEVYNVWQQTKQHPLLQQKSAICITTINSYGFPDGRFVDLKQVDEKGFTICSSYQSDKGKAIACCNKVALTAWWEPVGYQIRIQGWATKISEVLAERYWQTRNYSAQIISSEFQQSQVAASLESVQQQFQDMQKNNQEKHTIARPADWGGYHIEPLRIELLKFEDSRLHLRRNFTKLAGQWHCQILQP